QRRCRPVSSSRLCSSRVPVCPLRSPVFFFFFNDTAPTEIYALSLHDALPIYGAAGHASHAAARAERRTQRGRRRSEEHTSELQSLTKLVCRLLLEKTTTHGAKSSSPARARPLRAASRASPHG